MVYAVKTDLIPLLENLVAAIEPFAKANFVHLHFKANINKLEVTYHPEILAPDLTQLLCRAITFTPQEYEVTLEVKLEKNRVRLCVWNTGVCLDYLSEITSGLRQKVSVKKREAGGTLFEWHIPLDSEKNDSEETETVTAFGNKKFIVPPFFKKLRKSLRSHFTDLQNLEKAARARSDREGVFLKKVNAVILAHLDREGFDTAALSRAMALSRSQLYRRLKPLIRLAPATYIKYVRLQKAKEMLDSGELTVGEVAFRTGFVNQSHFTRAFRAQFGFNPSDLRRNQKNGDEINQSQGVLKITSHE